MLTSPPRRRRVNTNPVSVSWRWARAIVWPCLLIPLGAAGCLEVNGGLYDVLPLTGNGEGPDAPVVGFRLTNLGNGRVYDLDASADHWSCDCPDSVFAARTDGLCKHRKGLRQALEASGQL